MKTFTISIDISAPPERVWAVMKDGERWHEWTASVTSIRLLDPKPLRVGHRAVIKQPKFPPALWKVTHLDEGRSFTWVSTAPGLRTIGTHSVAPIAGGTRATLRLDYDGLLGGFVAWLTKGIVERYVTLEANGLKARSESDIAH